jgi:phytoene dehydrogenase-like protein
MLCIQTWPQYKLVFTIDIEASPDCGGKLWLIAKILGHGSELNDTLCSMTKTPQNITVIGAGINGLVAANYLARAGHRVTLLERSDRVGGACVSEAVEVNGIRQEYALGASTLGLIQDFVWRETGLTALWITGSARTLLDHYLSAERTKLHIAMDVTESGPVSLDCVWTRLLTPRDLQQTFGFPGGNIEHTMLVEGQSYFDRQYAGDANRRFYQFGTFEHVSICGSSTYPCGSVAGTPGYMCASELLRHMGQ